MAVASVMQTTNPAPRNMGEITVERINVVDADGKLRMVLSNKDRQHPGAIDGITYNRKRSEAGLLFFNDQGDEMGGLTYRGDIVNGQPLSLGTFTFDQWKQDQTFAIRYNESNGQRSTSIAMWDRPDAPLTDLVKQFNSARSITDPNARAAAERRIEENAPPSPLRLYIGKTNGRASQIALSDAQGKPRLRMTVDANGNPRIEILDGTGKVTNRWPAQ
jgi:hypothetical protein